MVGRVGGMRPNRRGDSSVAASRSMSPCLKVFATSEAPGGILYVSRSWYSWSSYNILWYSL